MANPRIFRSSFAHNSYIQYPQPSLHARLFYESCRVIMTLSRSLDQLFIAIIVVEMALILSLYIRTRRLLPIACCQLPIACCLLPVACCQLPVACCQLPIACCQLPIACCQLPIAHWLLPIDYWISIPPLQLSFPHSEEYVENGCFSRRYRRKYGVFRTDFQTVKQLLRKILSSGIIIGIICL